MKEIFVCTANEEHEILSVEAAFENESDAAQWCKEKNSSKFGWFCNYTYHPISMKVERNSHE